MSTETTTNEIRNYQNVIFETIEKEMGQKNLITVPREFVNYTGNWDSAILLSQLLYWSGRAKRKDGGVYKSARDWREEIGLSEYEVKKSVQVLVNIGILTTRLKKANGAPTTHYYLDVKALNSSIAQFLRNRKIDIRNDDKMKDENISNSIMNSEKTNDSLTDITSETSSEIIFKAFSSSTDEHTILSPPFEPAENKVEDRKSTNKKSHLNTIPEGIRRLFG